MNGFAAFLRKEWVEALRSYRILILGAVFLLLGIMNPLSAKFLPELVNAMMPEGMTIALAQPQALDSYLQFFKNVPQIGLIVLVVVFSGMLPRELQNGTLVNLLTKGLTRSSVALAKLLCSILLWSGAYLLCFVVTYGYTVFLFPGERVTGLGLAALCLWLFGVLLLSVAFLGGVLFKNSYGSLLLTAGFTGALFLLNILPQAQRVNPVMLASGCAALLNAGAPPGDFTLPIVFAAGGTVLFTVLSVLLFRKKRI